jgi:hypothetical protein
MSEEDKLIELMRDEIKLENFKVGVKDGLIPRQGFKDSKDLDIFTRYQRLQQKTEVKQMDELISRVNTLNHNESTVQTFPNRDTPPLVNKTTNSQQKSSLPTNTPEEFKELWTEFKLDDLKEEILQPDGDGDDEEDENADDLEDLLDDDDFLQSYVDKL